MATEHRIQLTGPELDERLAQVLTNEEDIGQEQQTRETTDEGMQEQLDILSTRMDAQDTTNEQVASDIEGLQQAIGTGGSVDDKIAAAVGAEATAREAADTALGGRITAIEAAVGTGGSVDERIATEATARADADTALGNRMTTLEGSVDNRLDQQDAAIGLLDGHKLEVVDVLPTDASPAVTPESDVIYRLVITDSETGDVSYEDYMYNEDDLTTPKKIANYPLPGIDEEPTPGSKKLVESGGIVNAIDDAVAFRFFASPYSEPDVLSYVVDQNNRVFATINKDGSITKKVLNAREKADRELLSMLNEQVEGINNQLTEYSLEEMDALLKQVSSPLEDGEADVLKYLTDEKDRIFGAIKKDGTVYFYRLDAKNVDFDLLKMVSGEMSQDNPQVLKYLTDENDRCFGYIKKDGTVFFYKFESHEFDNSLLKMLSSDATYKDEDILKYLTDEGDKCFGYIKKDGTVVIYKAEIKDLKSEGSDEHSASEAQMATVLGLVATGVDNIEMSRNPKTMAVLNNLFTEKSVIINANNGNNKNLRPCFSLIDDDTADNQIPSSSSSDTASEKTGGYFSVLLPFTLSLRAKYNKPVPVGLACEGHRVGLTTFKQGNDNYTKLNENGLAVKWLHNNMGWNVLNHSMTAQLPQRAYYVDGIESELADTILASGEYHGNLSFSNTIVLDRLTGKWYEVNSTKTAWVERTPTKKYAQPFYQDYVTRKWYFNRDFDFDYSWGEWFKRADELGLPYERVIVHNGGTSHVYTAYAGRKYAYFSIRTSGIYNNPPIAATVNRTSTNTSHDYNAWSDDWVKTKLDILDNMVANKSWVVFMTHFNDQEFHRNYYLDGRDYPAVETDDPVVTPELRARDNNYPNEWIIPLKHDEISDLINGIHDYISTPPARLGISSWAEWHPCPGTQLAAFYYILDTAMSRGIDIVTPWDGWKTHGNILNIGIDRNGQSFSYDCANQTPYTDEEKSYLTIGADMSIRYYNSKQN